MFDRIGFLVFAKWPERLPGSAAGSVERDGKSPRGADRAKGNHRQTTHTDNAAR